jgi:hypothetical protein
MINRFARHAGPYTLGMFLEVGTNIGTVSSQFALRQGRASLDGGGESKQLRGGESIALFQ